MKLLQGIAGGALGMTGGLLVMVFALGQFPPSEAIAGQPDEFDVIVRVPIEMPVAAGEKAIPNPTPAEADRLVR